MSPRAPIGRRRPPRPRASPRPVPRSAPGSAYGIGGRGSARRRPTSSSPGSWCCWPSWRWASLWFTPLLIAPIIHRVMRTTISDRGITAVPLRGRRSLPWIVSAAFFDRGGSATPSATRKFGRRRQRRQFTLPAISFNSLPALSEMSGGCPTCHPARLADDEKVEVSTATATRQAPRINPDAGQVRPRGHRGRWDRRGRRDRRVRRGGRPPRLTRRAASPRRPGAPATRCTVARRPGAPEPEPGPRSPGPEGLTPHEPSARAGSASLMDE